MTSKEPVSLLLRERLAREKVSFHLTVIWWRFPIDPGRLATPGRTQIDLVGR